LAEFSLLVGLYALYYLPAVLYWANFKKVIAEKNNKAFLGI